MISLRSDSLSVGIKEHGAELCSIEDSGGVEYMWQADPKVWGRHAPILFPIVGRLPDDRYRIEEAYFSMKQHGFARESDFQVVEQSPGRAVFRLTDNESTRAAYPFEFALTVTYELTGSELLVKYGVQNPNASRLLFSIGAHPGFSCQWDSNDALEDYYLEFQQEETLERGFLQDGLLIERRERVMDGERELALTQDTFNDDAMIFRGFVSESVALKRRGSDRSVTVSFPGFPDLGIWAKPNAPFVCIEPWFGFATPAGWDDLLRHKPGIIALDPGKRFGCSYRITVDSVH